MSHQAPNPTKHPKTLTTHGHQRTDEYYWMNQRDAPEVLAHLEAENAYTEEAMAPVKELRETLYLEIRSRIKEEDDSVPYRWNGYWYQTRYQEGKEYPAYWRWPDGKPEAPELLLDVNILAEGQAYCEVADLVISPDNRLMAYAVDIQGRRMYTVRFVELETGKLLPDAIPGTAGEMAWATDNRTIFFIHQDEETLRNTELRRHRLGKGNRQDIVWFEPNEAFDLTLDATKSERYIVCTAFSKTTTEVRYLSAAEPDGPLQVFLPRVSGHEYEVDHLGAHWWIRSNRSAPNFSILRCSEGDTNPEAWETMQPHDPDVLIEDIELFDRWLAVGERLHGLTQIKVVELGTGKAHFIRFDEPAYHVGLHINPEADSNLLRYRYTSLTTPVTLVDYHLETHEKTVLKVQEVPGGYDAAQYRTERIWATAADGVQVPVSLVYRNEIDRNTPQPMVLYGYGSYGISMDPMFNPARLNLIDRGFIYAIAHIRGGSEMGRLWYEEQGKLMKKMNTFRDFIACAEHLIATGYTVPDLLFALGGSAGGLLLGAVINLRPDLWRGVVAIVPFVDSLTTMLDPSIPLTMQEYEEWGNPEDPEVYRYMLQYSPYDNIAPLAYPAVLAASGYHDSQVQYWEPAKWVARLRDHHTGTAPILLYMNLEAGHGGASGRFEQYREVALYYAFILGVWKKDIKTVRT